MIGRIILVAFMICVGAAANGQPGHFHSYLFSNSDFVVMGELIKRDTIAVEYIRFGGYDLPTEIFSQEPIDRRAINRQSMAEFMTRDSLDRAKKETEKAALEKPVKRKKSKYVVAGPPPGPVTYISQSEKIIRYSYIVSGLYKTCWTYGNEFPQADIKRGDTISLLILDKHLDSISRRELSNRELNIYFNEQYFSEQVPSIFKTLTLKQYYYKKKMYWMDPKRVWRLEEDLIQH